MAEQKAIIERARMRVLRSVRGFVLIFIGA
jgi:hypothetical protein